MHTHAVWSLALAELHSYLIDAIEKVQRRAVHLVTLMMIIDQNQA